MTKKIITSVLYFFSIVCFSQNEDIFDRLKAIENNGMTFFNIDGISISHQRFNYTFNEKNLKKVYRKYSIKKSNPKIKANNIELDNFKAVKTDLIVDDLKLTNNYYFIKNQNDKIDVFWFGYNGSDNKKIESLIISSVSDNKIPADCFSPNQTNNIDFIGRELKLSNCYWTNINNVQCPYNGQMNWSLHKSKESADLSNKYQLANTKLKKNGKVISEEDVEIIFEQVSTKAKKVVYDFNGVTSLVAGGENLTIFYVSEKIRGKYISCVLSFWNNDNITDTGLTPLLEKVMQLKKK